MIRGSWITWCRSSTLRPGCETDRLGLERPDVLRRAKELGFSDCRLAELVGRSEAEVRGLREQHAVTPVYKTVDTCAAEFVAHTPYLYSSYEGEDEAGPTDASQGDDSGRRAQPDRSGH